jgi:hypothetical protein
LLGVTGRRRLPGNRPASGRATKPVEGSEWIRELFEAQSSFVEVSFFQQLQDVLRPFTVVFRADG